MNNVYLITSTKKKFIKSKGKNDHNEHPVDYKSFISYFGSIGKKPAPSQQDSVYCLWDETFR